MIRFVALLLLVLSQLNSAFAQEAADRKSAILGFEDLLAWDGLLPETSDVKEGKLAGIWESTNAVNRVRARRVGLDLSGGSEVSVWIHSAAPTGTRIAIVFRSERDSTEGADYFQHLIQVDWVGWRQVRFPMAEMRTMREPIGFHKVDEIILASSGYSIAPANPDARLICDGMAIEGKALTPPNTASTTLPGVGGFVPMEAAKDLHRGKQPMVIYFHTPEAEPCAEQERLFAAPGFVPVANSAVFVRINTRENKELAEKHKVFIVPLFLVFDKEGRRTARISGVQSLEALTQKINEANTTTP